jgi:hypothetical protein
VAAITAARHAGHPGAGDPAQSRVAFGSARTALTPASWQGRQPVAGEVARAVGPGREERAGHEAARDERRREGAGARGGGCAREERLAGAVRVVRRREDVRRQHVPAAPRRGLSRRRVREALRRDHPRRRRQVVRARRRRLGRWTRGPRCRERREEERGEAEHFLRGDAQAWGAAW